MTSAGFTLLLWGLYCLFLAISGQDYTTENPVTATYVSPREICSNQNSSDAKHSSCLMVQNWVQKKNAIVAAGLVNNDLPSNSPGNGLQAFGVPTQQEADQQAPLSSQSDMYDCMDLDCYCTKTGGTTNPDGTCTTVKNGESVTYGKSRRKECRMLTDDERNFLWHCIHALKWGTQQSTYNQKVYLHQAAQAPIAHGGPLFPCWHREYIKRYEFDLRNVHPNCQLCYWDSSLDNNLDDARQSCWWTDDFMGEANPNGTIKNGPFKNWTTVEMRPLTRMFPRPDGLIDKNDAKAVAAYDMMSVMAFTSDADDCTTPDEIQAKYYQLEYMHGTPHNFISGEMESTDTAPNDPMFHIHHCFVDYLWETWRVQENKSGNDPTQLYPEKYIVDNHCANLNFSMDQPMQPFNEIINRWCMSANYTNFLYDYEPSPTCNMTNSCGSPFLFCNYEKSSSGQDTSYCVAKIRPGGTCTKFSNPPTSGQTSLSSDDINPCYKSQCMNVGGNWTCVNSTDNNISNLIEIDVNGSNPVIRLDYKMKKGSDPVDTAKPIDPSKETYKGKPGGKKDDKKNDDKKKEKDKQKDDKKKDDKKEKKKKKKVKLPKIKIPPFRVCYDNHECCPQWSLDGYCANHTSFFMNVWCPASCECDGCMLKPMKKDVLCDDKHPSCKKWLNKKQTECTANQHWMAANCAKSCGICDKRESVSASCTGGPMAKGYYVGSFQLQGFLPRHVDEDNDEIADENNNENA